MAYKIIIDSALLSAGCVKRGSTCYSEAIEKISLNLCEMTSYIASHLKGHPQKLTKIDPSHCSLLSTWGLTPVPIADVLTRIQSRVHIAVYFG